MRYIDELLRNAVAEIRLWAGRRLGGSVAIRSSGARGVPTVGLGLIRPFADRVRTTAGAAERAPQPAAAPGVAADR